MDFKTEAKLLSATSKQYDIEGKNVISHKIRLNIEGEIFACKSTAEQVEKYRAFEKKDGVAVVRLTSPKEKLGLELVSFE